MGVQSYRNGVLVVQVATYTICMACHDVTSNSAVCDSLESSLAIHTLTAESEW